MGSNQKAIISVIIGVIIVGGLGVYFTSTDVSEGKKIPLTTYLWI